ncbi:hypothetical protein VP01_1729g6 [Puccinia sorghi]|uniref:Uncharacterized protein n=1 Tax=Puccinia sorghi TaxID=27349 RepID=A0A0L6VFE8_9BASI|nr:hypothetical protein VP01_1729g6 [Puccinia sorghi]
MIMEKSLEPVNNKKTVRKTLSDQARSASYCDSDHTFSSEADVCSSGHGSLKPQTIERCVKKLKKYKFSLALIFHRWDESQIEYIQFEIRKSFYFQP